MKNWTKIKNRILKFTIFGFLLLSLVLISLMGEDFHLRELHEGDVALSSIYSPFDFKYLSGIDEIKMRQLKEKARNEVLDVFDLIKIEIPLENLPEDLKEKSNLIKSIYEELYKKEFIHSEDKEGLLKEEKEKITVRDAKGREKIISVSQIPTLREDEILLESMGRKYFKDKAERERAMGWMKNNLFVNLKKNSEETERRKREAEDKVEPQYKEIEVKKGEVIINKGQRVSKEDIIKLSALHKKAARREHTTSSFGLILVISSLIIYSVLYLKIYEQKFFSSNKDLLFLSFLTLLIFFLGKLIISSPLPSLIIPVATAPMCVMLILNNPLVALLISSILSIFLGILMGNNLGIVIVFLGGCITGIAAIKNVRQRIDILKGSFFVGISHFFLISGYGFLNNLSLQTTIKDGVISIMNGIICGVFLMGILPLFESLFGYITNISLLELSDFNRPLLKEIFLKAPGTYHHSLIVGNLSETAAEAIGANSLLARVGAYYHDIGKIKNPEFFFENQKEPISKHENLSPSLSKLIILNHVKEGVELARKHKLKSKIIDFIQEHHGTSLIQYFYQKALEEDKEITESSFRYSGPKPKTKETAIVLLADSVEAATRALKEPTIERISSVVARIINNKFIDGQLNDTDLTLKDLEKISGKFIHILSGTYHARINYPKNNYKESSKEKNSDIKKRAHKTGERDS